MEKPMKFAEFVDRCQKLLVESPETGELCVFNTSCLDAPSRFETTSIYIGTVCTRGAGTDNERHLFNIDIDEKEIGIDVDDEGDGTEPIDAMCVVIGAF